METKLSNPPISELDKLIELLDKPEQLHLRINYLKKFNIHPFG